jgi:hypothetical protein
MSEKIHQLDNCPFYVPDSNMNFFTGMQKAYAGNQKNPFQAEALGHKSGFNLGVPGSINSYRQEYYQPNKKKS